MTYSVYQHWDPLKAMIVGKSYPPEVYDYIKNEKVRNVFYRIAEETEEDYQKLVALLNKLGVKTFRPDLTEKVELAKDNARRGIKISAPHDMQPRDGTIMLGDTFYCLGHLANPLQHVLDDIKANGSKVELSIPHIGLKYLNNELHLNGAMTSRVGKDLYIGTIEDTRLEDLDKVQQRLQNQLVDYRVHLLDTQGHTDGTFCPVVPGLILSIMGPSTYKDTFPEWEVVPLRAEVYETAGEWLNFKNKNHGKWWVPGEELNDDFTNFVEEWMNHWVGYIEESVFDLNLIVVDQKNVIVNGYNKKVFDAFSRYGITPHICNFRHRFFWDGGLHCITSDIHREGTMTDWFPQRNQ